MTPEATLARMLLAGMTPQAIAAEIEARGDPVLRAALRRHAPRLPALRAMLDAAAIDHSRASTPAQLAAMFDAAAETMPAAGVALYTLGDSHLLAAASAEIALWLAAENLVAADSVVLDLGCGTGRMATALKSRSSFVVGLDVSAGLLRAAKRELPDAAFVRGTGHDLGCFRNAAFDLVLAVDSFPYLTLAGIETAERHIAEAARVLRPGGALAIFNVSYRNAAERDVRDAAQWFARHGFSPQHCGIAPFQNWDGAAFTARRFTQAGTPQPNAAQPAEDAQPKEFTMSQPSDTSKQEEARNLVREAEQAREAGDRDEAQFLTEAAKELDPAATKER